MGDSRLLEQENHTRPIYFLDAMILTRRRPPPITVALLSNIGAPTLSFSPTPIHKILSTVYTSQKTLENTSCPHTH